MSSGIQWHYVLESKEWDSLCSELKPANDYSFVIVNIWPESEATCLGKSKQFTVSTLTMLIVFLLEQKNTFLRYVIKCLCTDRITERTKCWHHTTIYLMSASKEKFGYSHSKDQPQYA